MRAGAHALLPFFLACIAFVLISTLWQGGNSADFANAASQRAPRSHVRGARVEQAPAEGDELLERNQKLVRGRLVDAQSGEPVSALVSLLGPRGLERNGEAGADGVFQIGCSLAGRVQLAIPRTENHFGLVKELDLRGNLAEQSLRLDRRRDLPVVLRTPDGRPLLAAAPPRAPWARETWPTILLTQAPPNGRPVEGAPDPLLAPRVGTFLSCALGESPLRPGSPECCVGYLHLYQAPPVACSLVIGSRVLQTVLLDARDKLVSFTLDPAELEDSRAELELHVVDAATGFPPSAHHGLWLGVLGGPLSEIEAELDDDGHARIAGVPAGSVELHLRLPGYEEETRRVDLRAGERNDVGELQVRAGACLAGHVVDETGAAVRARVWSSTCDGREHPAGQVTDAGDSADWFAICGLPRGRVLVGLDDPRFALNPVEVDLAGGSVQNQRLLARAGSSLRLVGPFSAGGTAHLRVLDEHRLCLWKGDNLELETHELRLLPGRYTIEVLREGSAPARQEVDLEKTPDATIRLR